MTHQNDYTFADEIAEKRLDAIPELMRVLINNAMRVERSKYLQAKEYERSENRKGHANGFKPKTVKTRMGEITFAVPQVRKGGFYPSTLEKGLRSERALTTTQVSRAAAQLDEILQEWRKRPLGEVNYLYVDARYRKTLLCRQVIRLLKNDGYFWLEFTEKRLRNRKQYMFGSGQNFRKIKCPYVYYDILHVAEVLSRFPHLHHNPRFCQMLETITKQADAQGCYWATSAYTAWKGWSFADKKQPSPWISFLVLRILKRTGGFNSVS